MPYYMVVFVFMPYYLVVFVFGSVITMPYYDCLFPVVYALFMPYYLVVFVFMPYYLVVFVFGSVITMPYYACLCPVVVFVFGSVITMPKLNSYDVQIHYGAFKEDPICSEYNCRQPF